MADKNLLNFKPGDICTITRNPASFMLIRHDSSKGTIIRITSKLLYHLTYREAGLPLMYYKYEELKSSTNKVDLELIIYYAYLSKFNTAAKKLSKFIVKDVRDKNPNNIVQKILEDFL